MANNEPADRVSDTTDRPSTSRGTDGRDVSGPAPRDATPTRSSRAQSRGRGSPGASTALGTNGEEANDTSSRSVLNDGQETERRDEDTVRPEPVERRDPGKDHTPERTCILTRTTGERAELIRLAIAPDGQVLPDIRAKAPGRGAWIGVDRATLEQAQAKGRLKGALARAFKGKPLVVPDDLGQRIADGLRRAFLDRLGLEARAGALVTGADRIEEAARRGRVHALYHAADAGGDGARKLAQAWRVGRDEEGSGVRGLVLPADRTILAMALGRENVVHIAVVDRAAALRIQHALSRWLGFVGRDGGASPRDDIAGPPASPVASGSGRTE